MTKQKRTKFSKRRLLVFAIPVIALIGIGGTIAYNRNRSTFTNNFKLAGYQTLFTETFDAPQDWKTCETIDKTITVTNDADSSGPIAVRIKLEEQWLAADSTTELPLVSAASGLTMAQINFTANSGWTKQGSYYYYDTDLAKGATTSSLITGVTLNCDANLSVTEPGSDGVYADGTYHLKITAQAIDAASKSEWQTLYEEIVSRPNNGVDAGVDFSSVATNATGNGNGINIRSGTENTQYPIYYFRGEIDDNNIIWGGLCWKIVRTTDTGGTKVIYNGEPTTVNNVEQCLATNADSLISVNIDGVDKNSFTYGPSYSPAHVGYMSGVIPGRGQIVNYPNSMTFSNDVSRDGDIFSLDTSPNQSLTGKFIDPYSNFRDTVATRYHYFCIDYGTVCDKTKIAYMMEFVNGTNPYLILGDYDNIEELKNAMFQNNDDSNAKTVTDTWFEQKNLNSHEADLEDTIYCNERDYISGSLKSKDTSARQNGTGYLETRYNYHISAYRLGYIDSSHLAPSFSCASKRDSFTKDDSTKGNAALKYKIGLLSADEAATAGIYHYNNVSTNYLYSSSLYWTMTPNGFFYITNGYHALLYVTGSNLSPRSADVSYGIRPTVSLKNSMKIVSGSGLKTDPYIIE